MMQADLHVHTIASGHGYSTIEECCRAGANAGLKMIAITDHGPDVPGGTHPYYFGNLRVLPRQAFGVEILRGVEANIAGPHGELDLDERYLRRLDVVLVGFHEPLRSGSVSENTRALLGAMSNQWVHAVAHPGNPRYMVEAETIARAAADLGVAIEINNASLTTTRRGSLERCEEFARWIKETGAPFIISSDAHFSSQVGEMGEALKLVERMGLDPLDAINADVDRVKDFLRRRREPARR